MAKRARPPIAARKRWAKRKAKAGKRQAEERPSTSERRYLQHQVRAGRWEVVIDHLTAAFHAVVLADLCLLHCDQFATKGRWELYDDETRDAVVHLRAARDYLIDAHETVDIADEEI